MGLKKRIYKSYIITARIFHRSIMRGLQNRTTLILSCVSVFTLCSAEIHDVLRENHQDFEHYFRSWKRNRKDKWQPRHCVLTTAGQLFYYDGKTQKKQPIDLSTTIFEELPVNIAARSFDGGNLP